MKRAGLKIIIAAVVLIVVLGFVALKFLRPVSGPGLASRTTTYDVGEVVQGETVEHVFVLSNHAEMDARIAEVLPWTSEVVSFDSLLPAGGEGEVRIRYETEGQKGPIKEPIKVRFVGDHLPIWLELRGRVVQPVQVAPREQVYFFSVKGEAPEEVLEIINHESEPVHILGARSSNDLFRVSVDTLDEGRIYQLKVSLDPATPTGKHESAISVHTSSADYPTLEILGWARVKDVVSTSISKVDFARFPIESLDMIAVARRTVLVEKYQGTDFRVLRAHAEIPFVDVEVEPQEAGRSYLVHVTIDEARAQKGEFSGALVIETNDPDHPRFELPITGEIL